MYQSPIFAYFGTQDILIVAVIVLLLFGGAKIPQLMRGMGEGIREFRRSAEGDTPATNSARPSSASVSAAE